MQLDSQELFFRTQQDKLKLFERGKLHTDDQSAFDHLAYEITFNLERIALEKQWVHAGRHIPVHSLRELPDHARWYAFFIKRYTTLDLTPEEVYQLGISEVEKVKAAISRCQAKLGFSDSAAFYQHLQSEQFFITDKNELIRHFETTDSIVRKHLPAFIGKAQVPQVYPMEWPGAGPATPPAMYLNHAYNAYGKDVFQYNFYSKRFNRRAIEWLYMHEAIPGHHLQASFRNMQQHSPLHDLFLYPGNFEGWACYIEYLGKDVGLLQDTYAELGKWEWDLVRSARLVIDAGIHYYGWTHAEALAYWKATIPGQDEIAEREVNRVSNWAAQTLSYKAGADHIMKMKEKWLQQNPGKDVMLFHRSFLQAGMCPLPVIGRQLLHQ